MGTWSDFFSVIEFDWLEQSSDNDINVNQSQYGDLNKFKGLMTGRYSLPNCVACKQTIRVLAGINWIVVYFIFEIYFSAMHFAPKKRHKLNSAIDIMCDSQACGRGIWKEFKNYAIFEHVRQCFSLWKPTILSLLKMDSAAPNRDCNVSYRYFHYILLHASGLAKLKTSQCTLWYILTFEWRNIQSVLCGRVVGPMEDCNEWIMRFYAELMHIYCVWPHHHYRKYDLAGSLTSSHDHAIFIAAATHLKQQHFARCDNKSQQISNEDISEDSSRRQPSTVFSFLARLTVSKKIYAKIDTKYLWPKAIYYYFTNEK